MIFVAYKLNLPLNMEKPHYRSQRTGEWNLIWAHDSRPIYRPHQPRYIGLTLYYPLFRVRSWNNGMRCMSFYILLSHWKSSWMLVQDSGISSALELFFVHTIFFFFFFNSLAPGRFKFKLVIFKPILVDGGWGMSYEIALRWMPQDLTDDKSTLVQVMAWCCQAASHYLSQCWPRSMSPYGVTRPQWVKYCMCWIALTHFGLVTPYADIGLGQQAP